MPHIAERLDSSPLKRLHGLAALLCAVGFGIDLMEVSISNALSAVFSAPPHLLSPSDLSWLLASVYIGAILGAPLVGWIADHKGLQRTLAVTLLWLGLTSLLAFTQPTPLWFGFFRLLSGIALGAYPPLMIAYLTAISPTQYRGLMIFWACAFAYLAPPLGIFLIHWLTPLHPFAIAGWRWPFLIAGVAALGVSFAFTRLPESPRWLLSLGHTDEAERVCEAFGRSALLRLRAIGSAQTVGGQAEVSFGAPSPPAGPQLQHVRPFVVTLYFLNPWFTIAFPLLTGPILLSRGHRLSDALLYVAMATLGPVVGTLLTGAFVDRIGRRIALTVSCSVMALAAGAFFFTDEPLALAGTVVVFSSGVAIYTPIMATYGAELFPSATRASATTQAWAVNRLAAALVPVAMLPLFAARGPFIVGLEVIIALFLTVVLIAMFGPQGAAGKDIQ
jgi:MFS transporter, putative metabolite:H+ symporter